MSKNKHMTLDDRITIQGELWAYPGFGLNTQNAKIASITEKTLIVGIDVGSETHYAKAFD